MKRLLAPSILSADFSNLAQQIRYAEMGGADLIHCDVMDGHFVPNISFGPLVVEAVKRSTSLPVDVHLMIKSPEKYIKQFAEAGADFISVHVEEVVHLDRVINMIKELNVKAGVVLNPATPLNALDNVLGIVDFVLLMSVNPGFGGQSFIDYVLEKVKDLDKIRQERNLNFLIEVDGGIEESNIKNVSDAGCNMFVAGSAVFKTDNIVEAVTKLRNKILTE
jgi:ribulose-phosphate 3-epimerase